MVVAGSDGVATRTSGEPPMLATGMMSRMKLNFSFK
jgi:hypothetical protein